jgi:hypothetical protein
MLLVTHIVFALASLPLMLAALVNEFFSFFSNKKILPALSGISFAGLVATGTALIIVDHARVLSTCLSGLFYLAALAVPYFAYKKLASVKH